MQLRALRIFGVGAALAILALAAGNSGQVGVAQSCTVTVSPGQSIQNAINNASANAVICLTEGAWQENLNITKDNLILRGQGPSRTFVTGSFLIQVAGQFTVQSLTLQSAAQPGPAPAGMVLIPAGSFQMGDSFGEGDPDERPVHTVEVSAFYMDKYEVTKGFWDEVANWAVANGYDIKASDGAGKAGNHPVQDVTWYEVVKWANARSEREGLTPCYYTDSTQRTVYRKGNLNLSNDAVKWTGCGYRLPTEAEWEYAARGGCEGHRFPWCDTDEIQHSRANYSSSSNYKYDTSPTRGYNPACKTGGLPYTCPVGSFAANGYGLYDMAGNVWEWVWDWYNEGYYTFSPGSDPRGPASGSRRVLRGGSWSYYAYSCRVAYRDYISPGFSSHYLGFRLVRTAP